MIKIGLDFDGVIADSGALKVETAQNMFGVTLKEEDFKKEIILEKGLLTPEQYLEIKRFAYGDLETVLRAKEVPDAFNSIRALQKNNDVFIVTSRSGHFADTARTWLKKHSLTLALIETPYGENKKNGTLGCDVFVDDDLDKLEELIGHVPHLFLFSWPYNKNIVPPPEVVRVKNWNDLLQKIQKLQ